MANPALPPKANGAAPQQALAPDPVANLRRFLMDRAKHLTDALPKTKGLSTEKLIKLAIMAATKTPKLLECDLGTVFQCLMQCAELGLEPSGTLGAAYLIPYKQKCTLVIGYRGYIDLARRSGVLKQIEAHLVYENDKLHLRYGSDPQLEHTPTLKGDRGQPYAAYCVISMEGGAKHVEVMRIDEVDAIRARSMSASSGPWVTDYAEMAKKTVARRALKWCPMSSELQRAQEIEEDNGETVVGNGSTASIFTAVGESTAPAAPQAPAPVLNSKGGPVVDGEVVTRQAEEVPLHDPKTGEVKEPAATTQAPPTQGPIPDVNSDDYPVWVLSQIESATTRTQLRKVQPRTTVGTARTDKRIGSAYLARHSTLKDAP